jgi:hypothetical protein
VVLLDDLATLVGVFEYHAWVTIQDTTGDEGPSPATLDAIRAAVSDSDLRHRVSLDERNVSWFLTVHGLNNHRNPNVVNLFETVARIAPGSYGILFTQDDEAGLGTPRGPDEIGEHDNWWYCRVMQRGRVERHTDRWLSPHVPTVEDDHSDVAKDDTR